MGKYLPNEQGKTGKWGAWNGGNIYILLGGVTRLCQLFAK
jgi:hypothetical protein